MQKDMQNEIKYHTKEEALRAVTENGNELEFCTPKLKNNEEVVIAALKESSWSFYYASGALKSSKAFIMKALHAGVYPYGLVEYAKINIQSDIEVLTLALEKSHNGGEFRFAKEEAALSKELAAKALVKWGAYTSPDNSNLWERLEPTLQEFFPKDSWYEKSQSYLIQLEQEKQAEMVSGGCKDEDGVVW